MLSAEDRAALLERGEELARERDYGALRTYLEEAAEQQWNTDPYIGYLWALACFRTGRQDESLTTLNRLEDAWSCRTAERLYRRCALLTGALLLEQGELGLAEALLKKGLIAAEKASDVGNIASASMNLGIVAQIRCSWHDALTYTQRTLAAASVTCFPELLAGSHQNLGMAFRELGVIDAAMDHFGQAALHFRSCGTAEEIIGCEIESALLALLTNDLSLGLKKATVAASQARGVNNSRTLGESLRVVGILLIHSGELNAAEGALRESLHIAEDTRTMLLRAEVEEALARLSELRGDMFAAVSHELNARRCYLALGSPVRAARVGTSSTPQQRRIYLSPEPSSSSTS